MVRSGNVVVPHGQGADLETIRIHEAGHPVPDHAGVRAGGAVVEALGGVDEKTLVICLISGGGSALLVCPAAGVTPEDLQATNQTLLACGAPIAATNTPRQPLSAPQVGQWARAAAPPPPRRRRRRHSGSGSRRARRQGTRVPAA